jgi:hypothetical protein
VEGSDDDEDEFAPSEVPQRRSPSPGLATARAASDSVDELDAQASWINPWGAAALGAATLALLQASLVGIWTLTLALAVLGLVLVGLGIRDTQQQQERRRADRAWFAATGSLCAIILLVALVMPGLINHWWAIDASVPRSDANRLVAVNRDNPLDAGRELSADDWVDATTEAIRQDDVFVRVESVKLGTLSGKDGTYLQVHLRVGNCKNERTIAVEGFGANKQRPLVTDEAGRSYDFVEQRPGRPAKGGAVFSASTPAAATLGGADRKEYLLLFSSPVSRFEAVKLAVPASAWNRKGVCKLRISRAFDVAPIRKTL